MSDRPPENPGPAAPDSGSADAPARSLSEILEELAQISHAQRGEASAMRGAVSELSRALARLFEMIRADRATQSTRIAELEEALAAAQAHIRELESGAGSSEEFAPPSPTDFDALRGAAERLRLRTEALVRAAGTPADEAARAEAAVRMGEAPGQTAEVAIPVEPALPIEPVRPVHDEPFDKPGILRIFPGSVLPASGDDEFDVESELAFDEAQARQAVAHHAVPTLTGAETHVTRSPDEHAPSEPTGSADVHAEAPALPARAAASRPEPIAVQPREERKRRGLLRRRRIDARKLRGVDPGAALRAMVSCIDDLWTAGHPLDLVIALTDGGALHVSGGDRVPLEVREVEPGTPARSTVTATSEQIVPLFGRLDLTDEQSAPLIHGSRRDADLLVGWIDRAQRLTAEPL